MKTLTKTEQRPVKEPARNEENHMLPRVDIIETKDGYTLQAETPGVSKDGMEVLLEGNELVIIGRRNTEEPDGELLFRESVPCSYRRVFELDPAIDTEKTKAKMEQGILTLHLPKAERVKPRKIEVIE